jgi:hypothetical protein
VFDFSTANFPTALHGIVLAKVGQSSGSGAGKVTFNPFSITRKFDKSRRGPATSFELLPGRPSRSATPAQSNDIMPANSAAKLAKERFSIRFTRDAAKASEL